MRSHPISAESCFLRAHYAKEDDLLKEIAKQMEGIAPGMQISPEEGKWLQLLVRWQAMKTVVEIGTCIGYSTLWMARGLPPGGHIYTIERELLRVEQARVFVEKAGLSSHVTLYAGEANAILPSLSLSQVDMVFIDANKGAYLMYVQWAEKVLRRGGIIIVDDAWLGGKMLSPPRRWKTAARNLHETHDYILKRFDATVLPFPEGMVIAIKN